MIELIPTKTATDLHWYVAINNRESGPYTFVEILCMIHNTDISADDLIAHRGLGGWEKVKDFENFKPEHIEEAFQKLDHDPDDLDGIHIRRSIRIPISTEALVVANNYYFKCECIDLSSGGCLIKLPRGKVKVDSKLKLHFYKNQSLHLEAFNIVDCETVRIVSAAKLLEGSSYYDLAGIHFNKLKKHDKSMLNDSIRNLVFNTKSNVKINQMIRRQKSLKAA